MKKLAAVSLLIFTLSFPAFGGHTVVGDRYTHCDCGTPGCVEDYPGECGNRMLSASKEAPIDGTAELGIALVAILLWLRLKA
jgi:predicted NBD/HSP70 family sugar kinase